MRGGGAVAGVVCALALVWSSGWAGQAVDDGTLAWPGGAAGAVGAQGTESRRALAPAAAAPEQRQARPVHVVMLAPQGHEPDADVTPLEAEEAVDGASRWWSSQTAGAVRFEAVEVHAWQAAEVSCEDVDALWARGLEIAPAAAEAGHHLMVVVPRSVLADGCHYGFGSMGVPESGGSILVSEMVPSLVAHELGHNLGLGHAHALTCPGAADGVWDAQREEWAGGCEEQPYDDLLDVMGYSGPGFGETALNAAHVDQLGVDPAEVVHVPAGGGVARLAVPPMSSGRAGRAVRVEEPGGPVYYVEYRTPTGADINHDASGWDPQLGVRILRTDPRFADASGSVELDATPGDREEYRRALPAGGEFVSASGRVHVRVVSVEAGAATIEVEVAEPPR